MFTSLMLNTFLCFGSYFLHQKGTLTFAFFLTSWVVPIGFDSKSRSAAFDIETF